MSNDQKAALAYTEINLNRSSELIKNTMQIINEFIVTDEKEFM